jgi:hypothetical protein
MNVSTQGGQGNRPNPLHRFRIHLIATRQDSTSTSQPFELVNGRKIVCFFNAQSFRQVIT